MPFGTITVNTKSYEPRNPGVYALSTTTFGSPANEFRIRGAAGPSKDGLLRSSTTRILEKDVTVGGVSTRKQSIVTLTIAVPPADFTAADVDGLASDISEFLTTATITRLLQGEQ